jgi:transposase
LALHFLLSCYHCSSRKVAEAPKAIVAMAHHLARLVYRMLRYGRHYVEKGIAEYEIRFRLQRLKWLKREAKSLDMQLLPA